MLVFPEGEASGKPVKELMDTWTKKTGYPVLTITGEHHQHEAHGNNKVAAFHVCITESDLVSDR